jgi:hypothetical protein
MVKYNTPDNVSKMRKRLRFVCLWWLILLISKSGERSEQFLRIKKVFIINKLTKNSLPEDIKTS